MGNEAIQEGLANARTLGYPFVLDILISFYVIEGHSREHRERDEDMIDCHLNKAIWEGTGVRVQ